MKPSDILLEAAKAVCNSMTEPYTHFYVGKVPGKVPGCVAIDLVMSQDGSFANTNWTEEKKLLREETFEYFRICFPPCRPFYVDDFWWGSDGWCDSWNKWTQPRHMKARILGLLFAAEYAKQLGR